MDLGTLLPQGTGLPPGRVVHILRQVCEALAEAHGAEGYRDIKPANIVLSKRRHPRFRQGPGFRPGQGSRANPDAAKRRTGTSSPGRRGISPETLQAGDTPDPRSDLLRSRRGRVLPPDRNFSAARPASSRSSRVISPPPQRRRPRRSLAGPCRQSSEEAPSSRVSRRTNLRPERAGVARPAPPTAMTSSPGAAPRRSCHERGGGQGETA